MTTEDRNALVEASLSLAKWWANVYWRKSRGWSGLEFDDLYQVAAVAMVGAAERFEAKRGVAFSTFVSHAVRAALTLALKKADLVRVPLRFSGDVRRALRAKVRVVYATFDVVQPDDLPALVDRLEVDDVLALMPDELASVVRRRLQGKNGVQIAAEDGCSPQSVSEREKRAHHWLAHRPRFPAKLWRKRSTDAVKGDEE